MSITRSFWVTGASQGLGLALVERLLEQGHRVATSGRESQELNAIAERHGDRLLRLPDQIQDLTQAEAASRQLHRQWGRLDGLIVNAGVCDYLADDTPDTDLFEMIVSSNLRATEHALAGARPLLANGEKPQVMAILSRYSAQQLFDPRQPPDARNSLPQWLREQRTPLKAEGIDLTVVAPQSATLAQVVPEEWTAQTAALELVSRLDQRQPELVLEPMCLSHLWPLPR
ncbi:SDR family oxidoreductase [Pseudomonas entomophila]|uniref:SDR family NAD(P)-dependent oxidoreductase n=1 Tax=Pseudomonas entomophila TaxID=312306 RepID=A0ABY9QPR8_9PSED|nr:SDR family NAD(P)-dependent oxidoreductase [Pseudomonas entomophila]WMW05379.1 SDR family NAD(P)-dependent oxidoreductase [Pseudomonas entomophila]